MRHIPGPVDGSINPSAPSPKRGWFRAAWRAVASNGGWTNLDQVMYLIPCELAPGLEDEITEERVARALSGCVTYGYLIERAGKFKVAPLSFYHRQQELRKQGMGTRGRNRVKRRKKSTKSVRLSQASYAAREAAPRELWSATRREELWVTGVIGFAIGFLGALLLGAI